jgi:hypothetical protein
VVVFGPGEISALLLSVSPDTLEIA